VHHLGPADKRLVEREPSQAREPDQVSRLSNRAKSVGAGEKRTTKLISKVDDSRAKSEKVGRLAYFSRRVSSLGNATAILSTSPSDANSENDKFKLLSPAHPPTTPNTG